MGLKQEDLAGYGGPGVSTVGKFERAKATFPRRTQQQMEKALGWSRGVIGDFVEVVDGAKWPDEDLDQWEHDLIEDDMPDLTAGTPVRTASELADEDLLAELVYRMRRYRNEVDGAGRSTAVIAEAVQEGDAVAQASNDEYVQKVRPGSA